MLRETGNVGWTSECCHRITESFRSDMSYIFTMPSLLALLNRRLGMSQGHVAVDFENGKALAAVHGLH